MAQSHALLTFTLSAALPLALLSDALECHWLTYPCFQYSNWTYAESCEKYNRRKACPADDLCVSYSVVDHLRHGFETYYFLKGCSSSVKLQSPALTCSSHEQSQRPFCMSVSETRRLCFDCCRTELCNKGRPPTKAATRQGVFDSGRELQLDGPDQSTYHGRRWFSPWGGGQQQVRIAFGKTGLVVWTALLVAVLLS